MSMAAVIHHAILGACRHSLGEPIGDAFEESKS